MLRGQRNIKLDWHMEVSST